MDNINETECVKRRRTNDEDNEVLQAINDLITTDDRIISMLTQLTAGVEKHALISKWAKVGGTSATTVAVGGQIIGLALAPFTGGASLWINAASTAVLIGGVTTNVSVNITDIFKSKKYIKSLEGLLAVHDEEAEKFRNLVENIRYVVDMLKKEGVEEDEAIFLTLKLVKDGSLKMVSNLTAMKLAADAIKASLASGALNGAEAAAIGSQSLSQTLDLTAAVKGVASGELLTFANLIKNPSLLTSGTLSTTQIATSVVTGIIGIAGIAITTAVTIWEAKNLVRDWNKNHPTINVINDVINKLRKEKESLENLSLPQPLWKQAQRTSSENDERKID